jgi:hypothetical protein
VSLAVGGDAVGGVNGVTPGVAVVPSASRYASAVEISCTIRRSIGSDM